MKIAVIGAGAAGLFVASILSQKYQTFMFDGNEKCGKKLYITGKGRCNVTNASTREEYLENVVRGQKFMYSASAKFTAYDLMALLEDNGLKLKVERGARVFPESDKSSDVIKTLERMAKGAHIILNERVECISSSGGGYHIKTQNASHEFDKVVIATGGKSYSATGSTGDGYKFAKMLGHSLVELKPALVPIQLKDDVSALQGLPLKNVTLHAEADGKKLSCFGEMMFTDIGITGPIVLTMSSYINRAEKVNLWLDFKPALTLEQLDARLLREFQEDMNKTLYSVMRKLLPKNFVEAFLKKAQLAKERKVNSIRQEERTRLCKTLKFFPLEFKCLYPLEAGVVTSGGVSLEEINPKTMESKINKGLYFIGEVLDIDCLTGGFNLQTAFSTAYVCGQSIIKEEL